MRTSRILCSRCMVGMFATVCAALAAIATMMLGWVITAHGAQIVPDDAERQNPILCERVPDAICPPDFPGLVTMPATLAFPGASPKLRGAAAHRAVEMR